MRIRYVLHGMTPLKRDHLDENLRFYLLDQDKELAEVLNRFKNNRGLAVKLLGVLRRNRFVNMSVEQFINCLEMRKNVRIMEYSVSDVDENGDVVLEVCMNSLYFDLVETIRNNLGWVGRRIGRGKKEWVFAFENELRKEYTKDFDKEILED